MSKLGRVRRHTVNQERHTSLVERLLIDTCLDDASKKKLYLHVAYRRGSSAIYNNMAPIWRAIVGLDDQCLAFIYNARVF